MGDDIAAGEGPAHTRIPQVRRRVGELRMFKERPSGHRPHRRHVGVVEEQSQEPGTEVAGGSRQANEDLATSKTCRASSMWRSVWVAITEVRRSARLGATAGARAQLT